MSQPRVIVVKIGGSLLTADDFPRRLRSWLDAKTAANLAAHLVLVVGGGKWVDAIRDVDARTPLGDERAHSISVGVMDVTAGLVAAMLPELQSVESFGKLTRRVREPGITLVVPSEFVEHVEPTRSGTRLPANWSVTSDSIAGRLAVVLGADELVLLKSVPPPIQGEGTDQLAALAAAGYVDAFLPSLQDELPPLEMSTLPP